MKKFFPFSRAGIQRAKPIRKNRRTLKERDRTSMKERERSSSKRRCFKEHEVWFLEDRRFERTRCRFAYRVIALSEIRSFKYLFFQRLVLERIIFSKDLFCQRFVLWRIRYFKDVFFQGSVPILSVLCSKQNLWSLADLEMDLQRTPLKSFAQAHRAKSVREKRFFTEIFM